MGRLADLLAVAGFTTLCWGLWEYDPRLAKIVGGGLACWAGVMLARGVARKGS